MTLFADLVSASAEVARTSSRSAKVTILAELLARLDPSEIAVAVGFLSGGDSRKRTGIPGSGPKAVITDLCILRPEPESFELTVASIHPGISRERIRQNTGWAIRFAENCEDTIPPTGHELEVLRQEIGREIGGDGDVQVRDGEDADHGFTSTVFDSVVDRYSG